MNMLPCGVILALLWVLNSFLDDNSAILAIAILECGYTDGTYNRVNS